MNYLDYIIIIIAVIGFLLGFKDGLIRKIIGLIGLIAGIGLAFEFSDEIGKILTPFFNNDNYLANIISGILIFLIVVLIASIVKRIVHPLDKVNRFLNQLIGGIIGSAQIIFFLSGFMLFLDIFSFPAKETQKSSLFYQPVHNIIPATFDLIVGHHSKISDIIKDFIESKDKNTIVPSDSTKSGSSKSDTIKRKTK